MDAPFMDLTSDVPFVDAELLGDGRWASSLRSSLSVEPGGPSPSEPPEAVGSHYSYLP